MEEDADQNALLIVYLLVSQFVLASVFIVVSVVVKQVAGIIVLGNAKPNVDKVVVQVVQVDARMNVLVRIVRELHVPRLDVPLSVNTAAIIIACLLDVKLFVESTVLRHAHLVAECPAPKVHVQLYVKMHVTPNAPLVHSIAVILVLITVRTLAAIAVMISVLTTVTCSVS